MGRKLKIRKIGAPSTIRTCDLPLRRGTLYPAELSGRDDNSRIIGSVTGCEQSVLHRLVLLTRCTLAKLSLADTGVIKSRVRFDS